MNAAIKIATLIAATPLYMIIISPAFSGILLEKFLQVQLIVLLNY